MLHMRRLALNRYARKYEHLHIYVRGPMPGPGRELPADYMNMVTTQPSLGFNESSVPSLP